MASLTRTRGGGPTAPGRRVRRRCRPSGSSRRARASRTSGASIVICPTCVRASAIGPWRSCFSLKPRGASEARRASRRASAWKNRASSSGHDCGGESCQTCRPSASAIDQSSRSPTWASTCPGVRIAASVLKSPKRSGAPRTALPPRYASVASAWRSISRSPIARLPGPILSHGPRVARWAFASRRPAAENGANERLPARGAAALLPLAPPPPDDRGEDAGPPPPGPALQVVLRNRPGGDRDRRRHRPRARRLHPPDAPQPRGLHRARPRPAAALPAAPRPRGRLHQGPRPHLPLRHPREGHRRDDQPPRRDAAGRVRPRPGRAAEGRPAGGGGLHRRRGHERGRLPRGAEPRRGLEAAGAVRGREQPLGALDPGPRAVRLPEPRRPRHRLRDAGRRGGRQRPPGRPPRGAPGGRAGAAGRRADAPRVQDVPDARPRGGLGHRLRAEGRARGVGEEGPGEALRGLPRRDGASSPRPTSATIRAAYKARIDALADEALLAPEPRSTVEEKLADVFAPSLLVPKGALPGGRSAGAGAAVRGRDQRRPPHGDAPRRARRPPRAGHRRVRRRLQGDRGLRRGVRQGPRAQHADHRVGGGRLRPRPRPRRPRPHGRDAVRGLHHLRLQPDRQQPRQDPLAVGRARAGRHPRPGRGRHGGGPLPLAVRGVVVHARWRGSRSWRRRRPTTPRAS